MLTTSLPVNQSGTVTDTITWTDYDGEFDPTLNAVQYTISASNGVTTGSAQSGVISVAQDDMPDLITIPPSDGLEKEEEPVISPVVTTSALLVDDIDVPVEIKADTPIKVEIDGDGTWRDVHQYMSPRDRPFVLGLKHLQRGILLKV